MSTYLCAYDGCHYPTAAFGWCTGHYTQATTAGALTALPEAVQAAASPAHPPAADPAPDTASSHITVEELAQALDLELPEPADQAPAEKDAAGVDAAATSTPRTVRRYYPSFAAAFHDQVRPTPGCWEWEGSVTPNGLPILRVDGQSVTARRYTYEFLNGPIPEGRRLRNRNGCATTCVNPAHYGHKTN